jgi:hypothetical protein
MMRTSQKNLHRLINCVGGIVGTLLEREVNAHRPEVLFDVSEVSLLGLQDLLLLVLGGAAEGRVLVAGEPVPLEVAVKLEQN